MNTADLANERVFAEIKRLCLMGFDSTTLRQRFTERLSRAVPYEGYVAFTMDPSSGLITDALVEEMGNERTTRHFLEDVLFEDDILEFNWMVRNRLPVGLLSEATGGKLEHALRYRELIGPAGFGYELRGAFSTGATELWGGLCLTREKGRPDFDARAVAFIRRIAPHLGAGLRAATLQQELHDNQVSDDAAGVLVLDRWGMVVQHNAAAERRLPAAGACLGCGRERGARRYRRAYPQSRRLRGQSSRPRNRSATRICWRISAEWFQWPVMASTLPFGFSFFSCV
jgi:hypothetical protein